MKLSINGEVYDFDMDKMLNVEAIAIERASGLTFGEWAKSAENGSIEAMTALVWIIRKRTQPDLRFNDVEFSLASVKQLEDDGDDPKEDEPASD